MKNLKPYLMNPFITIIAYGILVYLGFIILEIDSNSSAPLLITEHSFTEGAQLLVLFIMTLIYLVSARKAPKWKSISYLLAACSTIAFIRESDFYLDEYVFNGAWQLLVFITAVFYVYLALRDSRLLADNMKHYFQSGAYGITLSGFLVIFIFSRLYGQQDFWQTIMNENYIRSVKNVSEEGTELLGYILLLIGAIEFPKLIKRFRETHDIEKVDHQYHEEGHLA